MAFKNAGIDSWKLRLIVLRCSPVYRGHSPAFLWPLVLLDQIDAHLGELVEDVLDLLRGELVRRQDLIQLTISDIAPLFGEPDHPLNDSI
jgi:hypothetical protein